MERVLRRTALAKNQAARRARILEEKRTIRDRVQFRLQNSLLHKENTATIRSARKNRREDWELGPIAPWRAAAAYATVAGNLATGGAATGSGPGTGENGLQRDEFFGTFSARRLNPPKVPEKYRVKDWFIREGDRVVVAEGREGLKGKIGKVKSLDKEAEIVILEGINMIDIRIPSSMQTPGTGHITTVEAPLPLSSLKLVYPLPDPVTGIPRDVVLNKVVKRNAAFDPYRNTTTWSRYLSPQNVLIPWPEESEPAYSDEKADTLRIDVEAKTFLPTLLRPPMPGSVIDELRNKYSKFRERHDESWLELRRQEDEEQKRLDELSGKLMPKGARNIARKHPSTSGGAFMADKKAVPRLREPLLRAIGEHMANKQMEKIRRDLVQ